MEYSIGKIKLYDSKNYSTIKLDTKIVEKEANQKDYFNPSNIIEKGKIFSISGTCRYCSGQIDDFLMENIDNIEFSDAWSKERLEKVLDIWKKYHLNDLNAGTDIQTAAVEEFKETKKYEYNEVCNFLESKGILVDRGYRYGSAWLFKSLTEEDEKYINSVL